MLKICKRSMAKGRPIDGAMSVITMATISATTVARKPDGHDDQRERKSRQNTPGIHRASAWRIEHPTEAEHQTGDIGHDARLKAAPRQELLAGQAACDDEHNRDKEIDGAYSSHRCEDERSPDEEQAGDNSHLPQQGKAFGANFLGEIEFGRTVHTLLYFRL
jgi:hypothetical protein